MKRRLAIIFTLAALSADSVFAESNVVQADFTYKRVGLPAPGATNRITVQIDPAAIPVPAAPEPSAPVPGASPSGGDLDWFWGLISPDAAATGPGRLATALSALEQPPEGKALVQPRLEALQRIVQSYGRDIMMETIGTQVSPALVLAVISVESAGNPRAISRTGAQGLMQLMPGTAERFDVANAMDASQNIAGGVAYLDWLINDFDRDPILYIAAYNAGEGAIRDNNGVPNYAETRDYVPKVLSAWTVARALCVTPPELMTDGCVFSLNGD